MLGCGNWLGLYICGTYSSCGYNLIGKEEISLLTTNSLILIYSRGFLWWHRRRKPVQLLSVGFNNWEHVREIAPRLWILVKRTQIITNPRRPDQESKNLTQPGEMLSLSHWGRKGPGNHLSSPTSQTHTPSYMQLKSTVSPTHSPQYRNACQFLNQRRDGWHTELGQVATTDRDPTCLVQGPEARYPRSRRDRILREILDAQVVPLSAPV